jgi:hypothetical protein
MPPKIRVAPVLSWYLERILSNPSAFEARGYKLLQDLDILKRNFAFT